MSTLSEALKTALAFLVAAAWLYSILVFGLAWGAHESRDQARHDTRIERSCPYCVWKAGQRERETRKHREQMQCLSRPGSERMERLGIKRCSQ